MRCSRAVPVVALAAFWTGCGGDERPVDAAPPHALPESQARTARGLLLPRLRLAPIANGPVGTRVVVHVVFEGVTPKDSTIQARAVDAGCAESLVDSLVVTNGNAVVGALVWVDGPGAVQGAPAERQRRPQVLLEGCRLQPRVQVAAPGSTIQLVSRDARADTMLVVPSREALPVDTVAFNTDGQLVPLQSRADSTGVIAIFSTRLPWARAFIAIAPPGASQVSDMDGTVRFTVDGSAQSSILRAWHPTLGLASVTINPSRFRSDSVVTLRFRR